MGKLTVVTIVGTRPEIIKLSRVIHELDRSSNHVLIHTGQNYDFELNEIFFRDLGIRKPDYFMNAAGENAAETIGNVIKLSDELFERIQPDALLLYGDTNSCLAVISAKRRKIPIFHMEAGNRCFDLRVPEELNRKVVDHLSDVNLVLSEHARMYLLREGMKPELIFKIGSPMKEVFNHYKDEIEKSRIIEEMNLTKHDFFVVSIHREENVDDSKNLDVILEFLLELAEVYKKRILVSTHPRTLKRMKTRGLNIESPLIEFLKPFGFFNYIKLQQNAKCVISDSGTITEESSIMGFPAVNLRQTHERPEGMDEASVILTGLLKESMLNAVAITIDQKENFGFQPRIIVDYNVEIVSRKVLRIIYSYVGYINKYIWQKY
jgi:UDP-N-acetylglucosamine 2-epimerase (non-hydrolysing)